MIVCLFVFRNGQVFLSAILVDFLTGEEGRGLFDCHHKTPGSYALVFCSHDLNAWNRLSKGLFTWSGGPRSSGVSFFCFHALGDTKQKKLTPLDRGPPLHVNRP